MATVKKIKKAQTGAKVPKGMVESEMNPGKMIPKSKSNYENGNYNKMLEGGKKAPATKSATKKVTKAKNGKSFPDLNKDGKVTKADILKGRGVIAKKGAKVMPCASCGKSMKKK